MTSNSEEGEVVVSLCSRSSGQAVGYEEKKAHLDLGQLERVLDELLSLLIGLELLAALVVLEHLCRVGIERRLAALERGKVNLVVRRNLIVRVSRLWQVPVYLFELHKMAREGRGAHQPAERGRRCQQ